MRTKILQIYQRFVRSVRKFDFFTYLPVFAAICLPLFLVSIVIVLNIIQPRLTLTPFASDSLDYRLSDQPTFVLDVDGLIKNAESGQYGSVLGTKTASGEIEIDGVTIKAYLERNGVTVTSIKPEITPIADEAEKFTIKMPTTNQLSPGNYKINTEVRKNQKKYSASNDFTWGVLALNVDQSVYKPNQNAYISMAVLDEKGMMVCDAKVSVSISDPDGEVQILSTENAGIQVSKECDSKDYTKKPDFYATYQTGKAGTYKMTMKAETKNGLKTIEDKLYVEENPATIITRESVTRVYPPLTYKMKLTIYAGADFSGKIKETIPKSFMVLPQNGLKMKQKDDDLVLTWQAKIKAGSKKIIEYQFKTPDESPQFYLLGPLTLYSLANNNTQENRIFYQERRPWQIAADATYQYTATDGQINSSDGTQRYNDYNQTRAVDGSTWTTSPIDITGSDTSLDEEVTIGGVELQSANKMILTFRASTSNVTLHYVFSIYDVEDGIWRPLNNHTAFNPLDPTNLTNFYSQELTPAAINTLYTYQFEIFDGYFADTTTAPGTKITTELADFISSGDVRLRISSNDDCGTATWFMNWDFAQVEVGIDPGYAPSAAAKEGSYTGAVSRYYSDLYTSDNAINGAAITNSLTAVSASNAVDLNFTFSNITTPSGANTLLLWLEDATSVANLSGDVKVYFWNYTSSGWEATAVSSGDASSTTISQNLIWMFSTPVTNHISGGEAKVRIAASHSTSFNLYIDWLKLIVGSTNTGSEQNNVSVGTPSGSLSDAGNVDTTAASPAVWTLTSSNTYTNQFYGDTNSTYSVAADWSVPMNEPTNANITGVHLATRTNNSSATPVTPIGLRDYANAWSDFQTRAAGTAYVQHPYMVSGNVYRYPVWGSFGSASAATTATDTAFGSNPQDYHDSTNNLIGLKIRTTTGVASSFTVGVDFAFASIRYISSDTQLTTQFTPSTATKNTGGAETNTYRFTKANDSQYWTIANSGAGVGVDVDLEFQNVVAPTTWNRLIVNVKMAWTTASSTFNMQIYDYTNTTWRVLGGHGQATTDYQIYASGTGSTQQYYQFEVFDGYFRNTDATPGTAISTPVANFIGTGGDVGKVKVKIIRGTTTSNAIIDWAQIELAQDNTYYARSASFNGVGTSQARFYNDTFFPDASAGTASPNFTYSLQATKAGAGTDRLNTQLNFENVTTPYSDANAIMLDTQVSASAANLVMSIQIYNFTNGNWNDTLNTGTIVGTTNRYSRYQFIRPVTTWADYINPSSPNDVRIRFYTTNTTAATFYIDYARISLGTAPTSGSTAGITWGTSFLNDKATIGTLDTTAVPSLSANTGNAWYINSSGTGRRTLDGLAGVAANVELPISIPSNSLVTGVKWAAVFSSNSSWTVQAQLRDYSADYTYANPNAQYLLWAGSTTANPGLAPTAGDANSLASATQTFVSGLYQTNPEDMVDPDKITFALRTSASSLTVEQNLIWDAAFVTLRYVGM